MAAGTEARRLAWQVLSAVERGAFADAALGAALRSTRLAPRDRALAVRLVYGVLAWQALLDHVIAQCGRDPQRLDPPLRILLRLGIFQLLRLDRVPEFAAVDTTVELSKEFKGGGASGLVNAVLRRFLREGKPVVLPDRGTDPAGHLALAYSHPRWMVELWLAEIGPVETEALLAANNTAAPTAVRVNRARAEPAAVIEALARARVVARPTSYAADALGIELVGDPAALPGHRDGWFTVQGEASQLVGALVGAAPGDRVLDACAAPGGKSTFIAERLQGRGMVVAVDRNAAGLRHLHAEASRLGLSTLAALRADAVAPPLRPQALFDAVLVDAPCSGLGTLRQHPDIKWRRQPASVGELARLQAALLAAGAGHVRPGGALVYATCTISRAENDDVVARFLAGHAEFVGDDPTPLLPPAARGLIDAGGALRTAPHRDGLDGFYAVRLKRLPSLGMVRP